MAQKDQDNSKKPGLPEAIHPEIGNGALWENDPHLLNLRSVDPTISNDQHLMDEDSITSVLRQWNNQLTLKDDSRTEEKPLASTKNIQDLIDRSTDELILKEDPNKPRSPESSERAEDFKTVPEPEGKRVKKAIKKAEKKLRKASGVPLPADESMESNLTPYTRWLKGLRGSEYVHPYEDDYGLERLSSTHKEGISETFADLLAAQGYKEQAIDMYKLLMAKYPKKVVSLQPKLKL